MPARLDPTGFLAVTVSKDCLITAISPGAEHLTEYSAADLVGRPLTQIMADRSVFEVPRMLDSVKQRGHWGGKMIHRCRTGRCFESWAVLTPLAAQDGGLFGYLLICMPPDASAPRCHSEMPIDEVGAHLRMVSHNLNNPLAVMMGFAQLILLNPHCEGQFRSDMEKLNCELKRVIQVVEELHGYAVTLQDSSTSRHAEALKQVQARDLP